MHKATRSLNMAIGSPLIWIAAFQVLLTLVALGRAKVLAILLSPSGFGVAATIDQIIMTVVQMGALGLPFASLKYMALAHSESDAEFQRVAAGFSKAILGVSILSALVLLLILQYRPAWIGAELTPYLSYLKLAALCVPAAMLAILTAHTLAAAQKPVSAAAMNFAIAFSLAVGAIVGVSVGGLNGLYAGTAIAGLLNTVASAVILRKSVGVRWLTRRRGDGGFIDALRRFPASAGFYMTMVSAAVSMFVIRYFVLADLGEASAGLLQGAMSIALTTGAILMPLINLYLIPLLNRATTPIDKELSCETFLIGIFPFMILTIIPLVCFPHFVLTVLYTSEFAPAAYLLFGFIIWQCLTQISYIYQHLLIGLDDIAWVTGLALIGFGSSALLAAGLIPNIGLIGAPAALSIGMAIYSLAILARLRWGHGITVTFRVHSRAAWMVAVTIVGGVLFMRGTEFSLTGFAARGLFAVICLGLTWLLFLRGDPAIKALILRLTRRRLGG
ncbi:MAG: hypothetical protein ACREEY_10790 [Brevundimonas sp.]